MGWDAASTSLFAGSARALNDRGLSYPASQASTASCDYAILLTASGLRRTRGFWRRVRAVAGSWKQPGQGEGQRVLSCMMR